MAKRVAKFEKVSFKQFKKDWVDTFGVSSLFDDTIRIIYDRITLPERSTKGSAGYDFVSPLSFNLEPGHEIKIPTGIRCRMNPDWVLKCYPRSSLGFKYRLQMNNTVSIIDSDYYYSDNEGHIFAKVFNNGNKNVAIDAGYKFFQGIFCEYGITEDDCVEAFRNGGIGSTDK